MRDRAVVSMALLNDAGANIKRWEGYIYTGKEVDLIMGMGF